MTDDTTETLATHTDGEDTLRIYSTGMVEIQDGNVGDLGQVFLPIAKARAIAAIVNAAEGPPAPVGEDEPGYSPGDVTPESPAAPPQPDLRTRLMGAAMEHLRETSPAAAPPQGAGPAWEREEGMDGGDVWTADHGGWRLEVQGSLMDDAAPSWEWEAQHSESSETISGVLYIDADPESDGWEAAANEAVEKAKARAGTVVGALIAAAPSAPQAEPLDTSRGTINCGDEDVAAVAAALGDACLAGGLSNGYYRSADDALARLAARLSAPSAPQGEPDAETLQRLSCAAVAYSDADDEEIDAAWEALTAAARAFATPTAPKEPESDVPAETSKVEQPCSYCGTPTRGRGYSGEPWCLDSAMCSAAYERKEAKAIEQARRMRAAAAPHGVEAGPRDEPEPGSPEDEMGMLLDRLSEALESPPSWDEVTAWSPEQRAEAERWVADQSAAMPPHLGGYHG